MVELHMLSTNPYQENLIKNQTYIRNKANVLIAATQMPTLLDLNLSNTNFIAIRCAALVAVRTGSVG